MYSRQPPNIAPSRFAPKATEASAVSENRRAKMMFAAKIGRNAIVIARTARNGTGWDSSQDVGTTQASSSPASSSPNSPGSGGVRNRRVTSTAASTATSTPPKTIALTTQVVPNSSANPVTLLVSSSRNAEPSRNRSP